MIPNDTDYKLPVFDEEKEEEETVEDILDEFGMSKDIQFKRDRLFIHQPDAEFDDVWDEDDLYG